MSTLPWIDGHVPASHPLSARTAMAQLPALSRQLMAYTPQSLWEQDTARLPWALQRWRRQARQFAC